MLLTLKGGILTGGFEITGAGGGTSTGGGGRGGFFRTCFTLSASGDLDRDLERDL